MIKFTEITQRGNAYFMSFENEKGARIKIPIDRRMKELFEFYFSFLSPAKPKGVEEIAEDDVEDA